MSRRKQVVLALAVGAVLFGGGMAATDGPLAVSGIIEVDEVRLASEFQGYIAEVAARAGDTITAGQILITLDSSSMRSSGDEARAALELAQAERSEVRAAPRTEMIAGMRAQVAMARAEQSAASAALRAADAGLRDPQSLQEQIVVAEGRTALARQNVELTAADQGKAQSAADAAPWNTPQRHILELQARAATENLEAARADLRAAEVLLEHLRGMRDKPLALQAQAHAAEGRYQTATAGVQVKQTQLDKLLAGAMPEELASAEAKLELAQARLQLALAQTARLVLRAPVTGRVLECDVNPGEVAMPGVTLLTVADLSQVHVLVYVPENRLGQVALGQKVDVVTDSFPDRPLQGSVTYISSSAEYTPRNLATKEGRVNTVYGVRIRLSNQEGLLKPGMAADVAFRP